MAAAAAAHQLSESVGLSMSAKASREDLVRERFTDAEWATLEFLPLWVFTGVAGIDGDIDHDETSALARELGEAALCSRPPC